MFKMRMPLTSCFCGLFYLQAYVEDLENPPFTKYRVPMLALLKVCFFAQDASLCCVTAALRNACHYWRTQMHEYSFFFVSFVFQVDANLQGLIDDLAADFPDLKGNDTLLCMAATVSG